MKKVLALVLSLALVFSSLGMAFADTTNPSPSPSMSPSPSPTATPSPSPTATTSPSPSPTATTSPSPSPTATATASPSPSPATSPAPTTTPAAPVTGLSDDAKACYIIGMLVGDGSGVTPAYTAKKPTRLQAAIMFLRLKGLDKDAAAFTGTESFKDAAKVKWAGGKAIMAYLKAHKELGWIGNPDGTFDPNSSLTAQQYYKVMLEALGYKANTTEVIGEFTWANTLDFAKSKGMSKVAAVTDFTVDNMASATVEALKAYVKDSTTKTLAASLVDAQKLLESKLIESGIFNNASMPLTVKEAKALNLNQILVTFSKDVYKDTAENASLYTLNNGGTCNVNAELSKKTAWDGEPSVVLQSDKKSVLITLDTKDDDHYHTMLKNQIEATLSVEKVKTADKAAVMAAFSGKLAFTDTAIPSVDSVSMLGTKVVRVKFTKPMSKSNNNGVRTTTGYRLDSNSLGNFNHSSITYNPELLTATITFGTPLSAGEHTLTVSKDNIINDIIGLKVVEKDIKFTVTDDQTAGTVKSATVDANKTYVEIEFSKPLASKDDRNGAPLLIDNVNIFSGSYDLSIVDGKLRIKDTGSSITNFVSGGAHSVNLINNTNNYLKDAYNVKYASSSVSYSLTSDTTGPTVVSVTNTDSNKVEVVFNETISTNTADKAGNFSIKNADGDAVQVTSSERKNGSNDTVVMTLAESLTKAGTGKVSVAGIKDSSGNTMTAYSGSFTIVDKIGPTVTKACYNTNHEVYVYFNENVDAVTATNSANYQLDNSTITGATFTAVSGSVIKISVPVSTTLNGSTVLNVLKDITDTSGNKMKGVGYSQVLTAYVSTLDLDDWNEKGIAVAARATDKKVIKIKLNKDLTNLDKTDFQFYFGNGWVIANSASFENKNGKATITFSFANDMMSVDAKSASDATVDVMVRANNTAGYTFNTKAADGDTLSLSSLNGATGTKALDKIAPELIEKATGVDPATTIDADGNGKIDHAIIWFAEKMNSSSLNTNSVDVSGYDVTDVATQSGTNIDDVKHAIINGGKDFKGDRVASKYIVVRFDEASSSLTPTIIFSGTWKDAQNNEMSQVPDAVQSVHGASSAPAASATAAVAAYEALPLTTDAEVTVAHTNNGNAAWNAITAAQGSSSATVINNLKNRVTAKRTIVNGAYNAQAGVSAYESLPLTSDTLIKAALNNKGTAATTAVNALTDTTVLDYKAALLNRITAQKAVVKTAGTVTTVTVADGDVKADTEKSITAVLKNANNVVLTTALTAGGNTVKYTWTCTSVVNKGSGHNADVGDVSFPTGNANPGKYKIAAAAEAGDDYVIACSIVQNIDSHDLTPVSGSGEQTVTP